jgi:hypothetical protein
MGNQKGNEGQKDRETSHEDSALNERVGPRSGTVFGRGRSYGVRGVVGEGDGLIAGCPKAPLLNLVQHIARLGFP